MRRRILASMILACLLAAGFGGDGLTAAAGEHLGPKQMWGSVSLGAAPESNGTYRIDEPASWHQPPIKVVPGGSRTLRMTLFNTGNIEVSYEVTDDDECIEMSAGGIIPPGDSVTITGLVDGSAPGCGNPATDTGAFIQGFINLTMRDDVSAIPVHAVVAHDYYECPVDSETHMTVDNGVLQLYLNANGEERISDIGTFPDTSHQVFFEGGSIVAVASGSDTVVGRFMLNDWRTITRDKLYAVECDVDWEPDFWLAYSKGTMVCPNHLEPPSHFKWFWWEVSGQTKIFAADAPELYKRLIITYVSVKLHRSSVRWWSPPYWWPDQSPFTGYEDTYIGVAEDIDCPGDTLAGRHQRNLAGYDEVNHIAWQKGSDLGGSHPEYGDYYCGVALADAQMPGESIVPFGGHNVRNDEYLYPQDGWGWKDGELYQLASTPGISIADPDSVVDRSWVLTARKIDAGSDANAEARFTVVRVVAPGGLAQLQEYVDSARAIVARERQLGGFPVICGDLNADFKIDVADVVVILNWLFKGCMAPRCPRHHADINCSGSIDLGDAVALHSYLFKGQPKYRVCPGIER